MRLSSESRRNVSPKTIVVILVALAIAGVIYRLRPKVVREDALVPAGTVYYTGPMKSKSGTYGNEDGTLAQPSNTLR